MNSIVNIVSIILLCFVSNIIAELNILQYMLQGADKALWLIKIVEFIHSVILTEIFNKDMSLHFFKSYRIFPLFGLNCTIKPAQREQISNHNKKFSAFIPDIIIY